MLPKVALQQAIVVWGTLDRDGSRAPRLWNGLTLVLDV
jgi:hypothetical protein